MQCLLYGNGSGNRNFRLLNGLTEPTNPREGDIWLKTEEEITGYTITGYTMDDLTELETKGHVYIGGGKLGGRNGGKAEILLAARMGEIKIIPFRWCIFNGTIWVVPEMAVYKTGQWVDAGIGWDGELYWEGEQYEMFTGGWYYRDPKKQKTERPMESIGGEIQVPLDDMCISTKKTCYFPKGKKYLCIKGQNAAYGSDGINLDDKGTIGFFNDSGFDPDIPNGQFVWVTTDFAQKIELAKVQVTCGYKTGIRIWPPFVAKKTNYITIERVWLE